MKELLMIDGNSLLYRAFFALPPLTTRQGTPTGAIYGFLNMLLRLLEERKPDYIGVAFDKDKKTFRHEAYADYKAGRRETPPELRTQFSTIRTVLQAMGIACIEEEHYEADDILGYFAQLAKKNAELRAVLVTGDNDALQLCGERVQVLLTKKGITEVQLLDADGVVEKLGVAPALVPDLKGLMGDSSDHLPGVAGIGPKTAVSLLTQYQTLENVLEHTAEIKAKRTREALEQQGDVARLCRMLATIQPNVPHMPELNALAYQPAKLCEARPILQELEMGGILRRLEGMANLCTETSPVLQEEGFNKPSICRRTIAQEGESLVVSDGANSETYSLVVPERQESFLEQQAPGTVAHGLLALQDQPDFEIAMDCKAIAHLLQERGVEPNMLMQAEDVALAAYACDPAQGKRDLAGLCQRYGIDERHPQRLALLWEALERQMREDGVEDVYRKMELPLWKILYQMERHGFTLSPHVLLSLSEEYEKNLKRLEEQIYEHAGHPFNINSPKQLGEVLFEELHLPVLKTTKTKGYSTDAEVLEQLSLLHPIVQLVLEYRTDAKLKSTYLDGLLHVMDENHRVHTRFTQTVTATGRLSSIEPNLQNIPVRTEKGREIRRAFVPRGPGRVLVAADYSQIELRLLAHFSEDETMLQTYRENGDIHADTAAKVFGVPRAEVTQQMRSAAKAVNFGIVYGISDFGLAKNIGVSREKASQIIATYFEQFSGVKAFLDSCVLRAEQLGYAETAFGRRRYIPELKARNFNQRAFGKRVAMNAPIQGTAADIIKLAMIRVQEALKEYGEDAVLILQVHDELIVDCIEELSQTVAQKMRTAMEDVVSFRVPLTVSVGIGKDWLSAK